METVSGQVIPQSSSTVVVSLPTDLLNNAIDGYWNEVKDRLHPELIKKATKGGFRDVKRDRAVKAAGGPSVFYRPVLLKAVSEYMKTQPRQALAYGELHLLPSVGPSSTIQATVYLEPSITWKKVPGEEGGPALEVKVPKLTDDLLAKLVDTEIERAREAHAILVPVEEPAALGSIILIDCQTLVDGKVWEPGTFKNNKWLMDEKVMKLPGMLEQLLGMSSGESKSFKVTFNDKFGDLNGKDGDVTIRMNQVYRRDRPELNDDLAISAGFESMVDWRTKTRNRYDEIIKQEKQHKVAMTLLAMFVNTEVVDIEPLPQTWVFSKAHEIYKQQRSMVRTEEDLLAKYANEHTLDGQPIKTKDDLLTLFAGRAAQMLVEDLVFRSYGKRVGIEGDTSLENTALYATTVRKVLLEKTQVIEVDTNATV